MYLSAIPVEVIKQEYGQSPGGWAVVSPFASRVKKQFGFTLVELVTVLVIVGVLGVAAIPRFFDKNVFDSRGFYDQVLSTLRFAQKTAIAQRRFVCVAFGANNVTLTIDSSVPRDNACDTPLIRPGGGAYWVNAEPGVAFNTVLPAVPPVNFAFDALGSPVPNAGQVITVAGYPTPIMVEAETGYVR